jgi:hypothetical protein
MSNSRRDFVKTAAGFGVAAGLASAAPAGGLAKRKLGKTDMNPTIMGLGGARTGKLMDHQQALDTIRRCYDLGVNYFDTAAAGAYGISQQRYGIALADVRDKIYIGTKTRHRTRAHSQLDLNQSLANMKTDYLDLYQVHNVMHQEDIDFIFGPRGLMEMIEAAKKAGKIRYVGVTGHMDPRILNKAIEMYDFDTVLIPLSVTDGANNELSFEKTTLPLAQKKGMGVIAMKTTGAGGLLQNKVASLDDCLNYAWSLPISTAIMGCTTVEQVEADIRLAAAWKQLDRSQMSAIRAKYTDIDFAALEPWKVDQMTQAAALPRYVGD